MSLPKDIGSNKDKLVYELVHIIKDNPWVYPDQYINTNDKHGRSVVDRQVRHLVASIGAETRFTLHEVIDLLLKMPIELTEKKQLLVAPSEFLDIIPLGERIQLISVYLESILIKAREQVILLSPFWDTATLVYLLRCVPSASHNIDLVLLLVHIGRKMPNVTPLINDIQIICSFSRVRLFICLSGSTKQLNYPHAKCMVVDKYWGYVGSANFTELGMRGHFEMGVAINGNDAVVLSNILHNLITKSGLFYLAWDTSV